MNAFITHISTFLPNAPVSNDAIEGVLGLVNGRESSARVRVLRNNGIKQRHYAIDPATGAQTHSNAQMTAEAVRKLGQQTGVNLAELSLLSCGTASPDQLIPAHGSMVHGELGTPPCEVFSAAGACTASMAALKYAAMAVVSGASKSAVVTGSELMSPLMRAQHFGPELESRLQALEKDPHVAFEHEFLRWMLSDGAGACLVEGAPTRRGPLPVLKLLWLESVSFAGQLEVCMYHLGRKQDGVLHGWKQTEPNEWLKGGYFNVGQDARLLAKHIGPFIGDAFKIAGDRHSLKASDVDWLLPHISSAFFRGEVKKQLERIDFPLAEEQIFTNLATVGNVGTASIFCMLEELLTSGRAKTGQRILCAIPESARFNASFALLEVV
jgi:3-oxoacyl-[acyl-carrier-protein] synthase III